MKESEKGPLTTELAAKLKETIDLALAGEYWGPGNWERWEPYIKCPDELKSRFALGLQLLSKCFVPGVGAYELFFSECAPDKSYVVFDEDNEEQVKIGHGLDSILIRREALKQ